MNAADINPFINSVHELFENMLDCKITTGHPGLAEKDSTDSFLIGVIGLSGTVQGIVALTLPVNTALNMIGHMVGAKFEKVDASIIDGVGELVNMIAGSAKTKFENHSINLSLPTVVRGTIYNVCNSKDSVFLAIPFNSELGDFSLMVAIKPVIVSKKEATDACISG